MLVHFRDSFDQLNQAELDVARLRLAEFLEPTSSYLSVVELGLYESTLKTYKALAEQGSSHTPKHGRRRSKRRSRARRRP